MTNIDRFKSFHKAATENNKILGLDTRMAYIIDQLREKIHLPNPKDDENIRVYYRLAKTCTFCDTDYYIYEREFMENRITYRELKKNQENHVVLTNFNKLMELVYIQPEKADYIYSSSEHFLEGDGNKEKRTVLENWLNHFRIQLHKAHCSGHMSKKDLEHAIKEIKPDILIPVHTQNPKEFKKIHSNVLIPEREEEIEI
ncbi:MAG: hypothetical protein B6U72_03135 [Candidatus Altiarchaeales archaeon ex4484_2]|nr:MAG: hypothetical protein B6U72_03135 [Candidatus Altiarchaeales archaeon ex4484_2]